MSCPQGKQRITYRRNGKLVSYCRKSPQRRASPKRHKPVKKRVSPKRKTAGRDRTSPKRRSPVVKKRTSPKRKTTGQGRASPKLECGTKSNPALRKDGFPNVTCNLFEMGDTYTDRRGVTRVMGFNNKGKRDWLPYDNQAEKTYKKLRKDSRYSSDEKMKMFLTTLFLSKKNRRGDDNQSTPAPARQAGSQLPPGGSSSSHYAPAPAPAPAQEARGSISPPPQNERQKKLSNKRKEKIQLREQRQLRKQHEAEQRVKNQVERTNDNMDKAGATMNKAIDEDNVGFNAVFESGIDDAAIAEADAAIAEADAAIAEAEDVQNRQRVDATDMAQLQQQVDKVLASARLAEGVENAKAVKIKADAALGRAKAAKIEANQRAISARRRAEAAALTAQALDKNPNVKKTVKAKAEGEAINATNALRVAEAELNRAEIAYEKADAEVFAATLN